jgi:hypothetical protein
MPKSLHSSARKVAGAALFAAAALLALAGCHADSAHPQPSSSQPASSQPASTVPPTERVITDPAAFANDAMQKALATTVHMDLKVNNAGAIISTVGDADLSKNAITVTHEKTDLVALNNTVYAKMPNATGKPWIKIDANKLPTYSTMRQSLDFRSWAGFLAGATSLKNEGGGRYSGVANMDKAISAAQPVPKNLLVQLDHTRLDKSDIDFVITVDGSGRLTSMNVTFATTSGDMTITETLSDFGKPVTISAPPATDVADAPADAYKNL